MVPSRNRSKLDFLILYLSRFLSDKAIWSLGLSHCSANRLLFSVFKANFLNASSLLDFNVGRFASARRLFFDLEAYIIFRARS